MHVRQCAQLWSQRLRSFLANAVPCAARPQWHTRAVMPPLRALPTKPRTTRTRKVKRMDVRQFSQEWSQRLCAFVSNAIPCVQWCGEVIHAYIMPQSNMYTTCINRKYTITRT